MDIYTPRYERIAEVRSLEECVVSVQDIERLLTLSVLYNEDERSHVGDYLRGQFQDFEDAVLDMPECLGVFGTGHPFYAWRDDGGVYSIGEVTDFTKEFHNKVSNRAAHAMGIWACAICQHVNKPPNLNQHCKPCTLVDFKPRDIFRVAPDVDFWVIVDKNSPELEKEIERRVREQGFYTSDDAIGPVIDTLIHTLDTLNEGESPSTRLPLDLHIIDKDTLLECFAKVPPQLSQDEVAGNVPIAPRSLHVNWESTTIPYNFLKDFLFSFTPSSWKDEELKTVLARTQQEAKMLLKGEVVDTLIALTPKEGRMLSTPGISHNLEMRVASW